MAGRSNSCIPRSSTGAKILLLSNGAETPAEVAGLLRDRGYGPSRIVVLEHMGGAQERRHEGTAGDWDAREVAEFNTVAVDCLAAPGAELLPRAPGLPDDAFRHDGQMTKREVRAITLARPGAVRADRFEYRLTEKGIDLHPVIGGLVQWGDRWMDEGDGPPVSWVHRTCGHVTTPKLHCSECGDAIEAREIRTVFNPPPAESDDENARDPIAPPRRSS